MPLKAQQDGLEEILAELRRSQTQWFGRPFLLGMLLAFALAGVGLYLGWHWIQLQIDRAKKRDAALLMETIDGPKLKQLCGNANLPAWIRYPDFERAQWVNDLLDQLWPNAKAAAAGIVRETIAPLLQQYKPAWVYDITIQSFSLGDAPPRISGLKVFNTDSVFDEVVIEMECIWDGSQRFQLAIFPVPKLPLGEFIGSAVSKFLAMRVGIRNLWFKGKIRIALKPLLDRMPLVGAAKLPKGILYVKVLEAQQLPWLDWLTFPDSYVELTVRGRNLQKTGVCKRSFNPRWDEEFMLLVHDPDQQSLNATVYDQDFIGADKRIGKVSIPIKDFRQGETLDQWHEIKTMESFHLGNPLRMGVQGVQSVRSLARNAIHLPFDLRGRKTPQLHLKLTYHQIGETDVKAAAETQDESQSESRESDSQVVKMLRGGVLLVKVKKEIEANEGGLASNQITTNIVDVRVFGQTRGTAATHGEEDPRWDETLEFAISGEMLEKEDEQIEVEVWDPHWVNKMRENLTWGGHSGSSKGVLHIPLRRVIDDGRIDDTFRLDNMEGSIDLELKWIPLLNSAAS